MKHVGRRSRCAMRIVRLVGAAGALSMTAVTSGFAMDATSADNLANAIIGQLGRSKGFVSVLN